MRPMVGLMLLSLLCLDVLPCGGRPQPPPQPEYVGLGEKCGGYTTGPVECSSEFHCCQPDPRVADAQGKCVKREALAKQGEPCGPSTGRCCAAALQCKVKDDQKGDGVCKP